MVDGEKGMNVLERAMKLVRKYKLVEWLELLFVVFMLGIMISIFTKPEKILGLYQNVAQEKHTELMEARRGNNAQIQRIADKLLYTFGADRAILLEAHNGANSSSGIPFLRCSATFETLNDGVFPVADQYQNVNISLMPFLDYVYSKNYWSGYTTEMQKIDKSLGYKMLSNSTEYFAIALIQGTATPLGYVILSFDETRIPEDLNNLEEEMKRAALKVAVLLEVQKV